MLSATTGQWIPIRTNKSSRLIVLDSIVAPPVWSETKATYNDGLRRPHFSVLGQSSCVVVAGIKQYVGVRIHRRVYLGSNTYVAELESLEAESSNNIELKEFIPLSKVVAVYFENADRVRRWRRRRETLSADGPTNFGRSLGLARRATDRWHAPPRRGCPAW